MASIARNIGTAGRRKRLISGAVLLLIGLATAAWLQVTGAPRGLRLVLLLPFAAAALLLLQARDHT